MTATRAAQPSDAQAIAECVAAAYRHYIPRMGKPPGPMLDDYAEVIRRHSVFVEEAQGGIVGVVVLINTATGILLDNIAVHPDHQRKGIGGRLLKLAESHAREHGHAHLDLYTHECMTENIARYQRAGYTVTEHKTERGYDRVYMRKVL